MKKLQLILLIALTCMLIACSAPEEEHKPRVFGATYMTRNNPFFDVLHESIEEVVEENGDILISRSPCQMQDKQNEQILEMIDEGIEVLFLNPVDWITVKPALEACKEAGVVVINIDTVVKDRDYVVSVIETDNYAAGRLCAIDMMKRVNSADIIIIGNPIQMSITSRVQGFCDAIAQNDNYRIVHTMIGAGEFEVSAEVITKEVLEKNLHFDVVLGGNDPSALGALAAIQQYGNEEKEDVLIYGIDGSPDFKAMLGTGNVTGTSAQSPKTIGRVAAELAYQYLNGEEVPEYLGIEPYFITKDNIDNYEINGWQ